jgi:hypothetical protein
MKTFIWLVWLGLLLGGCATTPRPDWNSRIGNYTYDQAVAELGPPAKSKALPDGSRVTDWLTSRGRPGSVGFGMDAALATPGFMESSIPYDRPPIPSQYLRLTFGPDGKLAAWQRFSGYPT